MKCLFCTMSKSPDTAINQLGFVLEEGIRAGPLSGAIHGVLEGSMHGCVDAGVWVWPKDDSDG